MCWHTVGNLEGDIMAKTRKPRGLVIGYLERISSGIFVEYRKAITDLIGGKHGIYALYRNNTLYYVGLATDLRRRVNQHLKDRHAGRWNFFSLYLIRSERHLGDLESLAMRTAYPKGNRSLKRFARAANLRALLQRKMSDAAAAKIRELMGGVAEPKRHKKPAPTRTAIAPRRKPRATRKARTSPLRGLLSKKTLRGTYKGRTHMGIVMPSGRIKLPHSGKVFDTPSGAAVAIVGRPVNGWAWWRFKNPQGEWVPLSQLRKP